jgi:hypothetical protein
MHRSRHPITIRMAPKAELTSDHFVILPKAGRTVDRPPVSFLAVLSGGHILDFIVPRYRHRTDLVRVGLDAVTDAEAGAAGVSRSGSGIREGNSRNGVETGR